MALSPDADMAIVKVSDIPMRNTEFLQSSLDTLFRRFGYILDIELHNTTHGDLFTGKATVVLDRSKPHDSGITDWSPLCRKLPWVTGTRNLLCSYEGMADFCSYCHEPGHARNACPAKTKRVECWNCSEVGHVAAKCPRPAIDHTHKKSRFATPSPPQDVTAVNRSPPA
ncbi:hypothetical protein DM01DRAFT_199622, partial [Hesseltinella vesiculosa]